MSNLDLIFDIDSLSNVERVITSDLLFLENRDRKYSEDIYELRGQYNLGDNDAFDLYTANGGTTGKYSVNWDESQNRCFAKFTVKPLSGSSKSVTVEGEALGFLKTSIDTRVYFIKNF